MSKGERIRDKRDGSVFHICKKLKTKWIAIRHNRTCVVRVSELGWYEKLTPIKKRDHI